MHINKKMISTSGGDHLFLIKRYDLTGCNIEKKVKIL